MVNKYQIAHRQPEPKDENYPKYCSKFLRVTAGEVLYTDGIVRTEQVEREY